MHVLRTAALAGLAVAVAATPALSAERTFKDGKGNSVRISLETADADGAKIARTLIRAVHGKEINRVTIRAVSPDAIADLCRSSAARACYRGRSDGSGEIVAPASGQGAEHALLHEYGHHIDNSFRHRAAREPNGTLRWWKARGLASLARSGEVTGNYSKGWERSIGEIFSEDYVQLNLRSDYGIDWLARPSAAALRSLRRDITGSARGPKPRVPTDGTGAAPPDQGAPPTTLENDGGGVLAPAEVRALAFGLLGPQRGVELSVRVVGQTGAGTANVTIVCNGILVGQAVASDAAPATISQTGLGPAECEARIENTSAEALQYVFSLSLSRPAS